MSKLVVTVVSVHKLDGNSNLKAFVDVNVGGIIFKGCTVVEGKKGLFASTPRKLMRDGRWSDVIVFENEELKAEVEAAILKAYDQAELYQN